MNEITKRYLEFITQLIDNKSVKDSADFARTVGVSVSSITEISKGRTNVGLAAIQKTVSQFPNLNLNWLILGVGEIFNSKYAQNVIKQNDDKNDDNFDDIPNVHKTSSNEKTFNSKCDKNVTLSNGNINGNKKGNNPNMTEMLPFADLDSPSISIPVVDISVAAGGGCPNGDYYDTQGVIQLPKSMISPGNLLCLKVDGRSMEPTIIHGGRVIVRHLEPESWNSTVKSGNVYVVVDRFGDSYIKRIDNQLRSNGALSLISDSADKRCFATFELGAEEISHIWAVEYYITSALPDSYSEVTGRINNVEDDMIEVKRTLQTILKRL